MRSPPNFHTQKPTIYTCLSCPHYDEVREICDRYKNTIQKSAFAICDDYYEVLDVLPPSERQVVNWLIANFRTSRFHFKNHQQSLYNSQHVITVIDGHVYAVAILDTAFVYEMDDLPEKIPKSLGNSIPDSIENLKYLEILLIDTFKIKELPTTICNLPRLRDLEIDDCSLLRLPEQISNLKSLENLGIRSFSLIELPESIGELSSLKNLQIIGLNLKPLSESVIEALEKLEKQGCSIRFYFGGIESDIPPEGGYFANPNSRWLKKKWEK